MPSRGNLGKKHAGLNASEKHGKWKGDNVGYRALHQWVRRYKSKPQNCGICSVSPPVDVANISGQYKRDLSDWFWVCRRCHMLSDGRILRLRRGGRPRGLKHTRQSIAKMSQARRLYYERKRQNQV